MGRRGGPANSRYSEAMWWADVEIWPTASVRHADIRLAITCIQCIFALRRGYRWVVGATALVLILGDGDLLLGRG